MYSMYFTSTYQEFIYTQSVHSECHTFLSAFSTLVSPEHIYLHKTISEVSWTPPVDVL